MLRALAISILGSALLLAAATPALTPDAPPLIGVDLKAGPAKIQLAGPAPGSADIRILFDPRPSLPAQELRLAAVSLLAPSLQPATPAVAAVPTSSTRLADARRPALRAEAAGAGLLPAIRISRTVRLGQRDTRTASIARSPVSTRRDRSVVLASRGADRGAVVQRLFGPQSVSGPALAYATLPGEPNLAVDPTERSEPTPSPPAAGGVAIYDIVARTVTLPSGERLEAHSGLGAALDEPAYVHLRMRGATPPGTYDLTMRESLFHGVRALRLNPVGGSAAVHGRAGLLAHTFMLGPKGESNGCISFRNYDRFLQAYLRGEVRRVVVVAGAPEGLPGLARRIFGMAGQRPPGT